MLVFHELGFVRGEKHATITLSTEIRQRVTESEIDDGTTRVFLMSFSLSPVQVFRAMIRGTFNLDMQRGKWVY